MGKDCEWRYYRDDIGLVRVKDDRVQAWGTKVNKWVEWDYKEFYPSTDSYGWGVDFTYIPSEEIAEYFRNHYGMEMPE